VPAEISEATTWAKALGLAMAKIWSEVGMAVSRTERIERPRESVGIGTCLFSAASAPAADRARIRAVYCISTKEGDVKWR